MSLPGLLLVEGRDDQWSIIHLMERHGHDWKGLPRTVEVKDCGGFPTIAGQAAVSAKSYGRLGIVLDADLSPTDRWVSMRDRLANVRIVIPATPQSGGFVGGGLLPESRVGVWLMPDNSSPGMLEDFLGTLVPQGDSCWEYAGEVVAEARLRGAPVSELHTAKARIHSWLAWREMPGQPFGTAMTTAAFAHDTPAALAFVAWFGRVFYD